MSRAPVEHFERLARESGDPWNYETSRYEQDKYRRTLDHLPERTGRTLELGCSIGVFTEMLAPRCESLLAIDFSPTALDRARKRMEGRTHVEVERRTLPEEFPEGPFDTIVAAELMYYWTADQVRDCLRRAEAALAPGGTLLAIHWRTADPRRELTGDDVHHILRRESSLGWVAGDVTSDNLLDLWTAPPS